jgi:hypothetical protein
MKPAAPVISARCKPRPGYTVASVVLSDLDAYLSRILRAVR